MMGVEMKSQELQSMSIDQLWSIHELLASELTRKITAERDKVDQRLKRIDLAARLHTRQTYPTVSAKYRNPARPSETWAGRGKQPRWLTAALKSGKSLNDFRI
jgi:DNA-binding protein H-NS